MHRFYGTLLGLDEIFHSAADQLVGFQIGTLQLTVQGSAVAVPADDAWASQLGWDGGTAARTSWGVELPTESFHATVGRLLDDGVPHRHEAPQWVGYWSFPVRDPMNNTVEVSGAARSAWPDDATS